MTRFVAMGKDEPLACDGENVKHGAPGVGGERCARPCKAWSGRVAFMRLQDMTTASPP